MTFDPTDRVRTDDLRALSEAALQAMNAEDVLHKLMREYQREGYSLREISSAVGMSHETVRRICSKDLNPGDELDRANA